MKILNFLLILVFLPLLSCESSSPSETDDDQVPTEKDGWTLVWNDEFKEAGVPDNLRWSYDVGGHGWGNQELQYYTKFRSKNARVSDGKLIIEAHKENYEGSNYTSARLVTKSQGDWKYGRIEVRAMLPYGRGTWPAIWMLPTVWNYGNGSWPDNGEIDIMEHVGHDQGVVHASVHTKDYNHMIGTQKTGSIRIPDVSEKFHTYTLEWYPDRIDAFVDAVKYFTFKNEGEGWSSWPFDKQFHLILNIAVGGTWGGAQGVDESIFPQKMEIDFVRVYQRETN